MIIHVFNAQMYHLSPGIIKGLLNGFRVTISKIILLEDGDVNRAKYESIFEEFNFKDYYFCSSDFDSLFKIFHNYIDSPILFHGGSFERWNAAFKAGCKNVNWICWGGDASKSVGRRKTQSLIKRIIGRIYDEWSFCRKKKQYKQFHTIVALIEPDRQTIVHDFNIPVDRVEVIPYRYNLINSTKVLTDELYNEGKAQIKKKPLVLIGNSPMNAPFYMQMVDVLKKFAGRIEVHCMYQYPHKADNTYMNLYRLGKKNFGDDFFIDEQFMNKDEYLRYLNLTDIYVCSNPEQTGIGAINGLFRLGKKMYITGKNYEYAQGIGCSVHNSNDIAHIDYDEFVKPDSRVIKDSNKTALENFRLKAFEKWSFYFKRIDSFSSK